MIRDDAKYFMDWQAIRTDSGSAIRIYDSRNGNSVDIVPIYPNGTDKHAIAHAARVAFAARVQRDAIGKPFNWLLLLVAIPATLMLWALIVWSITA